MAAVDSLGRVMRTLFFLAVLGFMTVILIGPVVALVSVLLSLMISLVATILPFVLVGLVIWVPYQLITRDPRTSWASIRGATGVAADKVTQLLKAGFRAIAWTAGRGLAIAGRLRPTASQMTAAAANASAKAAEAAREVSIKARDVAAEYGPAVAGACARGCRTAVDEGRVVVAWSGSWLRYLGGLFLEMVGAATVGAAIVAVASLGQEGVEERIALGAAAGAAIGFLVTIARSRPEAARSA